MKEPHKRFLVFGMDKIPGGGMDDLMGTYDTLEEADVVIKERDYDWYHIYDREEGKIIQY
tara:strand:+ start:20440 stop:20619 length:180 start_codon:yes stop_codon:yes gene_type:complete